MLKKILLTTAAAAVISSTSAYAAQDTFYIKAHGGFSKLDDHKVVDVKFKAKNGGFAGVGVGYHVMDNVRVDLTFDHFFSPKHTYDSTKDKKAADNDAANAAYTKTTSKANINSLMLNGFVDLFDAGPAKIFAGVGVGAAIISVKMSNKFKAEGADAQEETETLKYSNKTNIAFAGYLGASYELTPGVTAELAYSYKHLGENNKKNKDQKGEKFEDSKAFKYKGHHVGVGIRVAM